MTKPEVLALLNKSFTVTPIFIFIIFMSEFMIESHTYWITGISVIIGLLPWYWLIKFKREDSTIQDMMITMDLVSTSTYILLCIMVLSFSRVFPEMKGLYDGYNGIIIATALLVPFIYGLYYGHKRWSKFYKLVKEHKNYNKQVMTVWSIMDILTEHPDSYGYMKNYPMAST